MVFPLAQPQSISAYKPPRRVAVPSLSSVTISGSRDSVGFYKANLPADV
jgi:hypothetical protein